MSAQQAETKSWLAKNDKDYAQKQAAKRQGWYKYFEGDGIAFGERGRYYRWVVPFVMRGHTQSNWSFIEVDVKEYVNKKHETFGFWTRLRWDIWKSL